MKQWFLILQNFQNDLLNGLDSLPGWPEKVKLMQKKLDRKVYWMRYKF